jgi:hypothetical protein
VTQRRSPIEKNKKFPKRKKLPKTNHSIRSSKVTDQAIGIHLKAESLKFAGDTVRPKKGVMSRANHYLNLIGILPTGKS